jgi:hypothetical protein
MHTRTGRMPVCNLTGCNRSRLDTVVVHLCLLVTAFVVAIWNFALFQRSNGLFFEGILFHQFYYLYSTTAYCWCCLVTELLARFSRKVAVPAE